MIEKEVRKLEMRREIEREKCARRRRRGETFDKSNLLFLEEKRHEDQETPPMRVGCFTPIRT
jgi:hypothetical protein